MAFNSIRQFSWTTRSYAQAKDDKKASETKKEAKDNKGDEKSTGKASGSDLEAALKEAQKNLEESKKENAKLKDNYVRSVADFRNLQGTSRREMQKARDFALQKFSKDLIETIDNFDHAIEAVKDEELKSNKTLSSFYDGVKMTKGVFETTLKKHGITQIEALDKEFDPNRHEAVFQVFIPGKEPGTVCMVQQPGYELNGRVLRAAKVGVAKAPEGEQAKDAKKN